MGKVRSICIFRDGKAIWLSPEQVRELEDRRRAQPPKAPYIKTDSMPLTWHPANGQYYDSKSAFRSVTKAHGCEEVAGAWKPEDLQVQQEFDIPDSEYEADVAETMQMLEQGWTPPPAMEQAEWERQIGDSLVDWT